MRAGNAARFAVQWPRRVEALVLVRPAWLTQPPPDNLALLPRAAELLRRLGPEGAMAEFARRWTEHLPHARLASITSKSESSELHTGEFRRHLRQLLSALLIFLCPP